MNVSIIIFTDKLQFHRVINNYRWKYSWQILQNEDLKSLLTQINTDEEW